MQKFYFNESLSYQAASNSRLIVQLDNYYAVKENSQFEKLDSSKLNLEFLRPITPERAVQIFCSSDYIKEGGFIYLRHCYSKRYFKINILNSGIYIDDVYGAKKLAIKFNEAASKLFDEYAWWVSVSEAEFNESYAKAIANTSPRFFIHSSFLNIAFIKMEGSQGYIVLKNGEELEVNYLTLYGCINSCTEVPSWEAKGRLKTKPLIEKNFLNKDIFSYINYNYDSYIKISKNYSKLYKNNKYFIK